MAETGPTPAAPAPEPEPSAKICDVDRVIIERFLVLIRDNYPKADRASFFMEEVAGKTSNVVMANLRDVLSHLATALSEDTRTEDLDAQLASAEEHFRRAIQEPYAIALGALRQKFDTVHEQYRKIYPKIILLQKKGLFANAPNDEVIQAQLRKIAGLASEGRAAKRRNRIDSKWDDGVASCIEAYDQLDTLTSTLSGRIHELNNIKEGGEGKVLHLIGIGIGGVALLFAVLLVVFPSFATVIQKFFHVIP